MIQNRITQALCPLCGRKSSMSKETKDCKFGTVKVCNHHPIPEDK